MKVIDLKTRSRAKTIYTYAVHTAFWLGFIGFAVFKSYTAHGLNKQQVIKDAITLARSEGYTQTAF